VTDAILATGHLVLKVSGQYAAYNVKDFQRFGKIPVAIFKVNVFGGGGTSEVTAMGMTGR
jgi:hypothetical protein